MSRTLRRSALLVTFTALAVAACGTAERLAPPLAVRQAAKATAAAERTSLAFSLVGADADVTALFGEGEELAPEDAEGLALLRESRLVLVTEQSGERFAMELQVGDVEDAFELRVVDRKLFARADVSGLARVFGADTSELDAMVAGAREAGLGFVGDAVAGRWLAADLSRFEDLAGGGGLPGLPGGPDVDATAGRELFQALADTFGEDVVVTRVEGDHYRLSVPLRRVYEHLLPALGSLPGVPRPAGQLPPAEVVPDKTVSAEVWVSDGRISRAEIDLAQFSDTATGPVSLRVDVASPDEPVAAPAGAVEVDLFQFLEPFLAGLGEGLTTS